MKQNWSYRITTPTVAILTLESKRNIITVPVGVIVKVSQDLTEGDRLIDVLWNEQNYMMFTQDLRERAEPFDTDA